MGLELPQKPQSQRIILFDLSDSKVPFSEAVLLTWTRTQSLGLVLSTAFIKNNQWQLLNTEAARGVVNSRVNKRLMKKKLRKNSKIRCPWGHLKRSDVGLAIYKATHTLFACPGKTWEGPNVSLPADLEALPKHEVTPNKRCKVPGKSLKLYSSMHVKSFSKRKKTYSSCEERSIEIIHPEESKWKEWRKWIESQRPVKIIMWTNTSITEASKREGRLNRQKEYLKK